MPYTNAMEIILDLVLIGFFGIFIVAFLPTFFTGAPFAPTKKSGLATMVALSNVRAGERAIDIGSGDGRLVFALAEAGADSYGIEINPMLVLWSRIRTPHELRSRVRIFRGSTWEHDFAPYQVVTIFGIPYIMKRLEEKLLKELPSGARVVVNRYPFPTWQPAQQLGKLYLYVKS